VYEANHIQRRKNRNLLIFKNLRESQTEKTEWYAPTDGMARATHLENL